MKRREGKERENRKGEKKGRKKKEKVMEWKERRDGIIWHLRQLMPGDERLGMYTQSKGE